MSLQAKLAGAATEMMGKLEKNHGLTWIEVSFVMDAVKTVIAARRVLRDTYVYGYFLPDFVNRELFEFLQGQLESKVEELSGLIEKKDPTEVKNARLQVKRRAPPWGHNALTHATRSSTLRKFSKTISKTC